MCDLLKKIIYSVVIVLSLCVNASAQTVITSSNYESLGLLSSNYADYLGWYAITSSTDLKAFATKVNGGTNNINGVVTEKITIAVGDFTPIGTSTYPFRGTFKALRNVTLSASSATTTTSRNYQGLFGYNSGTIQNVTFRLSNVTLKGSSYTGGIAGYNAGSIDKCVVYVITAGGIEGTSNVGGIAGYNVGTIGSETVCTNNASVTASSYVGGICGRNTSTGSVYGKNTGSITASSYYSGGVVGYNEGTINNSSSNSGTITSTSYSVGGICGYNNSGGIIGGSNTGAVKGTYNVGGVCGRNNGQIVSGTSGSDILIEATAASSYVGGICGYNSGKMIASTTRSTSSNVKGVMYVGGVVGYNVSDTVRRFYARAAATVTSTATSGNAYCGGFCGYNGGKLVGVYNYATVSAGANYVGGIAGYNTANGVIDGNAKQCANVTGLSYVGGIAGGNAGKINGAAVEPDSYSDPLPVISATSTGKAYVGGICGVNTGTIRYAYPTAVVSGTMIVGGIVGQNSGKISRSGPDSDYSGLSVTATTSTDTARCGGVCGLNLSTGTIDTCHYGDGTVTGNRYIGGMCGDNAGTIQGGSSSSAISSTSGYAGGVCGNNTGTVTKCNAGLYGDVITLSGARSGGICGNNTGTISYCYVGTRKENFYSDSRFGFSFNGQYAGGICGYSTGTITGCSVTSCSLTSSNTFCGGICGYNKNIVSESDFFYSNITAYAYVGGVCGGVEGTTSKLSKCSATNGSVTLTGSAYGYAGGVAGRNYGGSISNCYSTVSVSQTGSYSSSYVGGLVGSNSTGSKIEYCYSQGDVTAKGQYVGGLVGYNAAQISNTYAYGNVLSTGYYVGGLIGQSSGTVTNSYYLADVAIDGSNTVQNGCGASSKGSTTADPSGVNKKSFYPFSSGEVCYLLNGSVNGGSPWGQNINWNTGGSNPDKAPVLETSHLVYKITGTDISLYSNNANYEISSEIAEKLANFEGDGSSENPFLIPDLQHLEDFRDIVKAGYRRACGKLTADIVINESVLDENGELRSDYRSAQLKSWIPIDEYQGCFDGDNHTIKGMFCMDAEGYKGLFAVIQSAEIKNLTVSDGYIKTSVGAAGFCVKATSSRFSNCHNTCVIFTDGDIPMTGGICGQLVKSTIEKCSNSGNVINTKTSAFFVGGLVGLADGGCVIRDSYNTGEVAGGWGYGGICGMSQVGGKNLIERCYNTGLVRSVGNSSSDKGAGILGSMDANDVVRNCYNTGTIIGVNVGGIVSNVPATSTVEYCYNAGVINGTTMGGIAGTKTDGATVTYNCYDKTVCSEAGGVNGVELSNQAFGHTTTVLCNSSLSTALNSYYNTAIWQSGTTENASTEIITEDNVFGYKIVGTYPSLKGVGEPQYAKTLWVNIGTAENPDWISDFIPIYTIEQLKAVSDNLDATYVLMNNVSESKNVKNGELVPSPSVSWTPINNFTGKFYGLGHTISGLYTESSDEYVGLFGITNGAMIKGIKIANSKFVSTHNNGIAGGIVGYASINSNFTGSSVIDCDNVSCTVEAKYEAGGIVGSLYSGYVEYCRNYGTVISNYANYAGGICGGSFGTIRYCYNEGTVSGTGANVGGIAGAPSTVRNCYNIGTLTGGNVGGIAGADALGTNIYNSYSAGTLSGSGSVGNIIGSVMLGGTITKCYYDSKNSEYDGVSGSMDREGKVESKTTDELCLALLDGLSSEDWAIKEPEIKDGKKYLYYPYLKHFGEESVAVGTYRAICKVTLNPNGGTCTPLTQYIEREGAELPQDVVREGYTFGGWYSNASCTSDEVTEIPVTATGEQTFYAKWTPITYSVTFYPNSGTINSGKITSYTYGNTVMLPTDVTRTGYTFGGWYTSSSLSGSPVTSITATNYGNKSFSAKWNVNSYNITYVTNNGTINDDEYAESYNFGVAKTLPTNVTKTGYTFAGWYTNDSYSGDAVSAVSTTDFGDKTYYAKWDVNSYDITLNTKGGTINNGNVTSYTYGVGATLPTDISKTGYTFGGWYDNSSCSGSPVLSIALNAIDDKEFWAKWDTINYIITYNANEGVFATTPAESYKYGDEVTLPVPTREGYTFAGWYNNSNLVGTVFTKVESTETGNKEFWAKWEVNTYTVSLDAKGGEINSGNLSSYTYNVLTILPQDVTKVGYTFEGWFDSENQKVTQISKGTIGNVTFTAQWTAKTYSVTLQANNGTINSGNVTSYTYGLGATLPEDVTKTGYGFLGWFDNSSYDGGKVTKIADNEIGNKNFWAKWTAASYDVTLDANGGTINSNAIERYTYGVGAVLPTDVTKIGYTFKGWKNEEDNFALEISTADYGDKTFTAQWEQANYGITYNANGGSINESYDATYNYGNEITLPTDVTKDGCEFQGWCDNSNFTGETVEAISATEYGDKTFYAKWLANSYGVAFNTNEGTINSGNIEGYTYGVTAILPTDVTKDGYTFTGWYSDVECEGEVVSIISSTETGNKTYYAGWSNTAYSVTLNTNDGIITSGNVTSYTYGTSVVLPTEIEKTGYTFGGWYDNSSYTGDAVTEISADATGNKTYYARWTVNTYAITLNTNGGTINSGMVASYVYGNGANLPTDVTKTGNTFAGWYADEELTGDQTIRIDEYATGDKTYYAKWTANEYTITYEVVGGSIEDAVYATNYTYGEAVNLPSVVTKSGHTFSGWYTNSAYEGSAITSLSETEYGNRTYYAKWTVNTYEVTLQANEGTVNNGNVSSYTYGVGATLPSDVTKTGYTFMGWYDNDEFAGESVSSIASNATGDKVYYAKWSINNYAVTLNANGGQINSGAVTSYEFGTEVLLPVDVTKAGHTFGGWYDNANLTGESCTAIVAGSTGNKTYYAKWTVNSYAVTLHVNEGTINSGNVTGYIYGSTVILPSDVTKTGNTFGGWYESETFEGDAVSTITASDHGDKTYYAKWTANVYDIILVVNEGTINAGMVENYTYGEGATLPTEVTKEGYSFGGWYSNSSYIGGSVSSIANNDSDDKQYWAKWTINEYEVSAEAENGTVEGTGSYEYKSTATLKATASEGYELTGWSTGSTETKIQIVVTADTTVTATFKLKETIYPTGVLEIDTLKTEVQNEPIELSGLFASSENGTITYSVVSSNPSVVVAEVVDGKLYLTTNEFKGSAEVTVTAKLPNGNKATLKDEVVVEYNCDIQVSSVITNVSCYGESDGKISLEGAETYQYQWVGENSTDSVLKDLSAGNYSIVITDARGCKAMETYTVSEPSQIAVEIDSIVSYSCNGAQSAIRLKVSGSYEYLWSDGSTGQDLVGAPVGEYSVRVTDPSTGCTSSLSGSIELPFHTPQISLVTVSKETGKNLVVWVRENTDQIDYYTIYRETTSAGEYDEIGTVKYTELSVFEDSEALPEDRQWSYTITATDYCGNETEMSRKHTTLHLNDMKSNRENKSELIWQPYEGIDYQSFYIIRETTVSDYTFIDTVTTVPSTITAYTPEIPSIGKSLFYVGIKLDKIVDPKEFLKAESGPFALALSNIAEAENMGEPTAIDEVGETTAVYAVGHTIYVNNAAGKQVEVYDVKGSKITAVDGEETMEITVRLDGVYLVNVGGETFKVIIQ